MAEKIGQPPMMKDQVGASITFKTEHPEVRIEVGSSKRSNGHGWEFYATLRRFGADDDRRVFEYEGTAYAQAESWWTEIRKQAGL